MYIFDPINIRYATDTRNMAVCVESYIGKVGGNKGAKLEDQYLVTDKGLELLSSIPLNQV